MNTQKGKKKLIRPNPDKIILTKKDKDKFEKHFNKITYFSPKDRKETKTLCLNLMQYLQSSWPLKDDPFLYSDEEREQIVDWTFITSKILKAVSDGEKWTAACKLRHKKFYFYLHREKPSILLEATYFKVIENRYKVASFLLPKGLPEKGEKVKIRFIREKLPKKEWELLDEGTFYEKYLEFRRILYTFNGKKLKFKLDTIIKGKDPFEYWIRLG